MASLDLAVITKNEEKVIQKCLDSVPFAKNKIVVDSESTDRTREMASECGAKVIVRPWPGFPQQKQFALDQCESEWVLVLDADEWLTEDAKLEIQKIIRENPDVAGFRIPRYQIFMGKILKYGKGVDYPLRLIRKGKGKYNNREIHEEIVPDGEVKTLSHGMEHLSSFTIRDRVEKMKRDVEMEIRIEFTGPFSLKNLLINPIIYFLSYFFKKKVYKDGLPGMIWLALFSFQNFLIIARHYENSLRKNQALK